MAIKKIRTGDTVIAISGKNKGKSGTVLKVLGERVLVEGLNLVKKHVKSNPQQNVQGGILEREASIHRSNLALLNPSTQKADQVGIKVLDDNRKVRYFKSNSEMVNPNE